MPLVTLTLQIGMALIWDLDAPVPTNNRYVVIIQALAWDIMVRGLVQPVAALFVALIVCPLMSFTVSTGQNILTF